MKRCACEIDRGAVTKPIYYVWMANAIECYGFVLKISNERSLEIEVRFTLQIQIQSFNDYRARLTIGRGVVVSDVDLGVTASSETLDDVVAPV
jgi:uncharacterized HAD superfamily protein